MLPLFIKLRMLKVPYFIGLRPLSVEEAEKGEFA